MNNFIFSFFLVGLSSFNAMALVVDWQGHRGARGLYPENTIEGMKLALKYPIKTLEMDVVISKDKKVVVSHEPWMSDEICLDSKSQPVKNKDINLHKLSYNEIQTFDCGSKIHPRFPQQKKKKEFKPLLENLLKELEKSGKNNYSIEIKSNLEEEKLGYQPGYKEFTDLVIHTILKQLKPDQFMVQSFDWRVLNYIFEAYPKIRTVALIEEAYDFKNVLDKLNKSPTVFSPNYELLTKDQVNYFHQRQIKVIPWTVNDLASIDKMLSMGVDGLITDYPNLIPSSKNQ